MRCVVFAYHDIGCMAIQTLYQMGETIVAVFTHQDDPKEKIWFGSVKKLSESLKLPTFCPQEVNTPEWIKKIKALKPDILFSFYYRHLISDSILAIPPKGGLNLHGSLLPKYRGRVPVHWAIIHGEKETGLTLHYMVKKADAGDIVAQKKVAILEEDTAQSVFQKLVPLTREILIENIPLLTQGIAPRIPQDPAQASTFKGRKPEDGKIDWNQPARKIYNLVRALTHPYPGAFTFLKGKKVLVWSSSPPFTPLSSSEEKKEPGTIVSIKPLQVQCGDGILEINAIQIENEPEEEGSHWCEKNAVKIGTIIKC